MRRLLILPVLLAALSGCATTTSFVHSDAALGRVVVYRNGIAYFERTARIDGDTLSLSVPADKVDDFLKSLTVVDARTGEPAPIAYPTQVPSSATGLIDMKIHLNGSSPHDLRVSYVTEAPSWKPSYRITLGKEGGKLNLQSWAIVDNTSGEDWQNVQLGVGSSSALSFRFDLRSIRVVQRETLRQDNLFAQAPPTGGALYANMQGQGAQQRVMLDMDDATLASSLRKEEPLKELEKKKVVVQQQEIRIVGKGAGAARGYGAAVGGYGHSPTMDSPARPIAPNVSPPAGRAYRPAEPPPPPVQAPVNQLDQMANNLKNTNKQIIVEGYADRNDNDKQISSLERANKAREQLIRAGVDPTRVVAVGAGEQRGRTAGVRIMEAPAVVDKPADKGKAEPPEGSDPIGTSHFDSRSRMSVPRGTSAMVSILSTETDGEVVYYYDAESPRGNSSCPFKAVRIKNPTDSVLETGPVTVFGEGKFIGEGMAEPIPARAIAFIPFALDRQIVVERKDSDSDKIARIITVQRGVFSTEVQHTKRKTLIFNNRLGDKATVYMRHTVAEGFKLTKSPPAPERLGNAYVFKLEVPANNKAELVIEESTPVFKTLDIRAPNGLDLISAYLSNAAFEAQLKGKVEELLKLHKEMVDIQQRIETTRDQQVEYRARMDELHAQLVTLKAVKTAGPLMQSLEKKLQEVSDRVSKATIDLVGLQEKLMVAKIKFQDGVADLSLEKKSDKP